jgi:hypothetical protein
MTLTYKLKLENKEIDVLFKDIKDLEIDRN